MSESRRKQRERFQKPKNDAGAIPKFPAMSRHDGPPAAAACPSVDARLQTVVEKLNLLDSKTTHQERQARLLILCREACQLCEEWKVDQPKLSRNGPAFWESAQERFGALKDCKDWTTVTKGLKVYTHLAGKGVSLDVAGLASKVAEYGVNDMHPKRTACSFIYEQISGG